MLDREEFIKDLFDLSQGNGDIPEIDEKVVNEAVNIFGEDLDREEFRTCYNQLFINGKSLGEGFPPGSGLYLVFSIMNHSCMANTSVVINSDTEIQVQYKLYPNMQASHYTADPLHLVTVLSK